MSAPEGSEPAEDGVHPAPTYAIAYTMPCQVLERTKAHHSCRCMKMATPVAFLMARTCTGGRGPRAHGQVFTRP